MTEQVKTPEVVVEPTAPDVPQADPIETKARDMGWRPLEEFEGDEENFIDAKEFVRRKPLFDKIDSQNKYIKSVSNSLNALKEHYSKVKETEYKNALAQLKQQHKLANREGEYDRADALENHIERVEQEAAEFQAEQRKIQVEQPPEAQEFLEWKSQNTWYDKDTELSKFADTLGITLHQQGMSKAEILKEISKSTRARFPDKFRNPNKDGAPKVEKPGKGSSLATERFELTDQERTIMKTLTKGSSAIMTEAEYIADLKKVKGIK